MVVGRGGPNLIRGMGTLKDTLDALGIPYRMFGYDSSMSAVVNYAKLLPYAWLGQLNVDNLAASLLLAPFAPVGIAMGMWLHNRISDRLFFRIACLFLFAVALKLIGDGFRGLF